MYARETIELHGSYPDLIPQDAPGVGWNAAHNVYFENGETKRIKGDVAVWGTPSTTPRGLVFYQDASANPYWVYAGADGVFVYDGTSHTDITPTAWGTPTADSIYTLTSFNGLVVINNSSVGPFYWDGDTGNICEPLPGWPSGGRCHAIRAHRAFLFAIGMTTEGGFQRVRWSDAAEAGSIPTTWIPSASNLAGFVDLMPSHSPALDGCTIRDSFYVFKGESVFSLTFIQGNTVFASRVAFTSVGIAGVNGWAHGPGERIIFVGSDGDVYVTDGAQIESALEGKARRTFENSADPDLLNKLAGASLSRAKQAWIFYPTAGQDIANRALIFDWRSGEVSFRDVAAPVYCAAAGQYLQDITTANDFDNDSEGFDDDPSPFDFQFSPATNDDLIAGTYDGSDANLMGVELEGNEDFDGSAVQAYAMKQGLAFGNPQRRKLITRIWPKVDGTAGDTLIIRVGGQEITGGATQWAQGAYTIGSDDPVDAMVSGRFLAIEVSSGSGSPWRLGTIDVEFREVGKW